MRNAIFAIVLLFCLGFANQAEACTGNGGWCATGGSCCSGYCSYFKCFHTCVDRQCKNGDIWCINSDNEWDHVDEECTAFGGYDSQAYCDGNWLQYDSYDYEPYCSNTTCKQEAVYSGMQVIDYCDNGCSNGECIECDDECSSGSDGCNNSGSKVWDCDYNSNTGCYEKDWANCELGTECDDGECVLLCDDECDDYGDKECMSSNMLKTCGNFDSDTCLEWHYESCNCYNDKCQSCQSNCSSAQVGCNANNTQKWTCDFNNTNGCYEKDYVNCGVGKVCNAGNCVSDCLPVQANKFCVAGKLVWKNSCNVQTSIIEDCDEQPDVCNAAGNVLSNGFCSPQDKDCYYAVETDCDCGCLNGSCKTNCYNSCASEKCHLGGIWCYDSNNSPHHQIDPCDGTQNGSSYSICKSGDEHVIQNQMQEICQNGACQDDWSPVTLEVIECDCGCQNDSCLEPCCDEICELNEVGCNSPSQKWTCLLKDGCLQKQTYQCGSNKVCSDGYCVNDCLPTKDYQTCENDNLVWKNGCDVTTEIIDDCTELPNVCSSNYSSVLSNGKCSSNDLDCYYLDADPCSCGCQAGECISPCCESNCEPNEKECFGFGYRECECDGQCCDWGDVNLCPEFYSCVFGDCVYNPSPCEIISAQWKHEDGSVATAVFEGDIALLEITFSAFCAENVPNYIEVEILLVDAEEELSQDFVLFEGDEFEFSWQAIHGGDSLELLVKTNIFLNDNDAYVIDLNVIPQEKIIEMMGMIDSIVNLTESPCLSPETDTSATCFEWWDENGLYVMDDVLDIGLFGLDWMMDNFDEILLYGSCYGASVFLIVAGIFEVATAPIGIALLGVCGETAGFILLEDTYPKLAYVVAILAFVDLGYNAIKGLVFLGKHGLRYIKYLTSGKTEKFVVFARSGKIHVKKIKDPLVLESVRGDAVALVKKYPFYNYKSLFSMKFSEVDRLVMREVISSGNLKKALEAIDGQAPSVKGFEALAVTDDPLASLGEYNWFKKSEELFNGIDEAIPAAYNVDEFHEMIIFTVHEGRLKELLYGSADSAVPIATYLADVKAVLTSIVMHEYMHAKSKAILVYELGIPIAKEGAQAAILEVLADLWGGGHPTQNMFGVQGWKTKYRDSVKLVVRDSFDDLADINTQGLAQAMISKDTALLNEIKSSLGTSAFNAKTAEANLLIKDAKLVLQKMLDKVKDEDLMKMLGKHGLLPAGLIEYCLEMDCSVVFELGCFENDVWWISEDGEKVAIKQPCAQNEFCQDGECVEGEVPTGDPVVKGQNYYVVNMGFCDVKSEWLIYNAVPSQVVSCYVNFGLEGFEQVACSAGLIGNGALQLKATHIYDQPGTYQVTMNINIDNITTSTTKQVIITSCGNKPKAEGDLAIENLSINNAQEATHMVISFDLYGSDNVPESEQFSYIFGSLSVDTDINSNFMWVDDHYHVEAYVFLECGSTGKHEVKITVKNNDQTVTAKKEFSVSSDRNWCSSSDGCSTSQNGQATGIVLFLLLGGILLGLRNRQRV